MGLYITILGFRLPSYGFFIALGVIIINIACYMVLKKRKIVFEDFLILEAYTVLGVFLGGKILYLMVSFREINWSKILDLNYFNSLMASGFVFYGSLVGGIILFILAGKIHGIEVNTILSLVLFAVPLMHAFGRMGCFFAGCCYGIPFKFFGSVIYPKLSLAPPGVYLFPVQLAEAAGLITISILLYILSKKGFYAFQIPTYLLSYGLLRFFLEFLRYDSVRGYIGVLSVSQWISLAMIVISIFMFIKIRRNKKNVD